MKKLRLFDSLKLVLATVACTFMFVSAHAATLPAGYTELEYLETDGNAYIDTGILLSTTDVLETELMVTNLNATKHMISTSGTIGPRFFQIAQTSSLLLVDFGTPSGGGRVSTDTITSFNNKVLLKANVATKEFYVNNTYVGNAPNSDFIGSANSIKLFALPGEPDIRIYNFKILGKINLVPARRDSDGVLGMYDLADANPSTAFHTNAGTGEFIAGEYQIKIATTRYNEEQFEPVKTDLSAAVNAVEYVVSNTMTQAQAIDTIATTKQTRPDEGCPTKYCLLVEDEDGTPHWYPIAGANGVAHALPAGYTELQYIESTGTQYIISPIKSVRNGSFFVDFQMVAIPDTGFPTVWGAMSGSSDYKVVIGSGGRKIYSQLGNGAGYVNTITKDTNRHLVTITTTETKETAIIDDQVFVANYDITTDDTLALSFFARNRYDGMNNFAKVRLYSAWHKNSDNELDFSVVPCKNPSGVLGLYDLVNDQFYDNDGTGDFVAGPEM